MYNRLWLSRESIKNNSFLTLCFSFKSIPPTFLYESQKYDKVETCMKCKGFLPNHLVIKNVVSQYLETGLVEILNKSRCHNHEPWWFGGLLFNILLLLFFFSPIFWLFPSCLHAIGLQDLFSSLSPRSSWSAYANSMFLIIQQFYTL